MYLFTILIILYELLNFRWHQVNVWVHFLACKHFPDISINTTAYGNLKPLLETIMCFIEVKLTFLSNFQSKRQTKMNSSLGGSSVWFPQVLEMSQHLFTEIKWPLQCESQRCATRWQSWCLKTVLHRNEITYCDFGSFVQNIHPFY